MEEIKAKPDFKRKCGQFIDALLESIDKYEDAFLGVPTAGNGYKIDDSIRKFLPELLNTHIKPFSLKNEGCPIDIMMLDKWGKDQIAISLESLVVHIGKLTSVKWERYAFVKGGGAMGENIGKLTKFTHEQTKKADKIASSVLGTDAGVLTPHTYSKLFMTELQNSFKWNKEKMVWSTSEFPINTKITINPLLKKFETTQYIRQIPRMFQKLTMGSDDDITFISDTALDASRVIAIHTKVAAWKLGGHIKNPTDRMSTPFQILQNSNCRKIMMKFVDDDNSMDENKRIRNARDEHMKDCSMCFVTFNHVAFGGGQDYAFMITILQACEDIYLHAVWDGECFRALDVWGVGGASMADKMKPGPCLFVKTGHYKLQGRIAAKVHGLLHAILKAGSYKDTVDKIAINVKEMDTGKFIFFNEALKCYFIKVNTLDVPSCDVID